MAASLASFFLLHHHTFPCPVLLLLLLLPSPSSMQTLTLTNPHILHIPSELPQSHHSIPGHAHENDLPRNNVPREEPVIQLVGDGDTPTDHQRSEAEISTARPYIYETVAASFGLPPQSLLHGNVPQADHSFVLDDGVESLQTRSLERIRPLNSRLDEAGNVLCANAQQGNDNSVLDDGNSKEVTLRVLDNKAEYSAESSFPKLRKHAESVDEYLHENDPQGDYAFLVDDGAVRDEFPIAQKENSILQNNVPQGEFSYLLNDGSNRKHVEPDGVRTKDIDGAAMDNLRLPSDEIQQRSSGDHIQQHNDANGDLPMVVDDRQPASWRRGSGRTPRGRSPTCTPNPDICTQQLADAEQYIQHKYLSSSYGVHDQPAPSPQRPACCGGVCVDLNSDIANCGMCGSKCILMQGCCSGRCVDLSRDMANCGRCSNPCPPQSPCQYGICGYY